VEGNQFASGHRQMNRPSIILLDSSDEDRNLIADLLHSNNFKVKTISTIQQALDITQSEQADLLLVALHLHDECGFELLRFLRPTGLKQKMPVVFYSIKPSSLSAVTTQAITLAAKLMGAHDVIVSEQLDETHFCSRLNAILKESATTEIVLISKFDSRSSDISQA
jgi:DNA-binding response OmpR family regulator